MSARIVIKADREKPIINQHPWVFSGAIDELKGRPAPGDIVDVVSSKGKFLARGYWNPKSQIQVRLLTWHDEVIDGEWWAKMIARSVASRLDWHGVFRGGHCLGFSLVCTGDFRGMWPIMKSVLGRNIHCKLITLN